MKQLKSILFVLLLSILLVILMNSCSTVHNTTNNYYCPPKVDLVPKTKADSIRQRFYDNCLKQPVIKDDAEARHQAIKSYYKYR